MKPQKTIYSDRFKFRVWDEENQCYQQDDADDCFIRQTGELVCVFYGDCDTMSTEYVVGENAVIEQCTGVRDKNGTLIYEGDILHYHFETNDGEIIDEDIEVEYDEANTGFDFWQVPDAVSDLGEVVGNIHEGVKK